MDEKEIKDDILNDTKKIKSKSKNKKRIKIRLVHFIVLILILVIIALMIAMFSLIKYTVGSVSLYMKYKNYNEAMINAIELLGKKDEFEESKENENEEYTIKINRSVRKYGKEAREILAAKGNMDIDDELVQELYNTKLLKSNSVAYEYKGSFYKNSKVTIKELSNEEKNITIIQFLEWQEKEYTDVTELTDDVLKKLLKMENAKEIDKAGLSEMIYNLKVFSEDEIKNAMIELFGKEIDVEFESFHGCAEEFDYIEGKYYFYNFPGGGYGDSNHGLGQIQYVVRENDYIYIYDKFAYRRDMDYEVKYKDNYIDELNSYFASSEDTVPVGIDGINVITNYDENSDAEIYELYNRLHLYKHTFKKGENDSYYWVSTEIEKE